MCDDYLFGIDLYNAGFVWEAHESWERIWRVAERGPASELLQGLIQCAAAAVKVAQNNAAGLRAVSERALGHLRAADSPLMGLDVAAFASRFASWAAGSPQTVESRPCIELRLRSRDLPGAVTDGYVSPGPPIHVDRDSYRVRKTPSRPDFFFGQVMILDDPPAVDTIDDWFARFRRELSDVAFRRQYVQWETTSAAAWPHAADLGKHTGYEHTHIIRADTWPQQPALPDAIEIRKFESDADWSAAVALSVALETELPRTTYEPFATWMYEQYRAAVRGVGRGAFWGAFDGHRLAGSLGLLCGPGWMRFQDVRTAVADRGRGICTSLISWALHEGFAGHPQAVAIIGVNPDTTAARVYARAGFRVVGSQHTLSRAESIE